MQFNRRELLGTAGALALTSGLPNSSFAQTQPVRGGTFFIHYPYEQRILNPAVQTSTSIYQSGGKVMGVARRPGPNGAITPVLATSWQASTDGKTYTFKLREGVRWHDGAEFTFADVQFTALEIWKKVQNFGSVLQENLQSVDVPDKHTAIFHYSQPMPESLLMRALCDLGYVAPKQFAGKDIRENPVNNAPIGTGPTKFVEYQRGQHIILARKRDYWQKDKP